MQIDCNKVNGLVYLGLLISKLKLAKINNDENKEAAKKQMNKTLLL